MDQVYQFVNHVEGISDVRKQFYNTMLTKRYEQILEMPYSQIKHLNYHNPESSIDHDEGLEL